MRTIDDLDRDGLRRLLMRCIACPPDEHPGEWTCAWEFELREA